MNRMNKEQTECKFEQLKGSFEENWGKLSDKDIDLYKGHREQFLGKLHEHYGFSRRNFENHIQKLEDSCGCASDNNAE